MKNKNRAVAVMVWFGDKIMLSKRLKTKTFSGFWAAAGGSVEDTDESLTAAASRELMEETGMYFFKDELRVIDCYQEGNFKCFIFEAERPDYRFKEIRQVEPDKHSPWELFTPQEALKLKLMPAIRDNLNIKFDKKTKL